jgi:hypothetical protein
MNRDKVAAVGANVVEIGRTLETMLGGREVTRFKMNAEQYDVKLQVADVDRRDPDDLTRIYVRTASGEMIQLSNLVTVRETVAPRELNHFNKLRSARISASVAAGYSMGQALERIETISREVMGPTAQTDYEGVAREFRDSSSKIVMAFLLALAFIYLVLAAQFESFVSPLVIMFSVPLAIAGALLALTLTGATLNIYSQIGLITLVGLITKHGILIVEFSNQLREEGKELVGSPPGHRLGDCRRDDVRHVLYACGRTDGLHLSGAGTQNSKRGIAHRRYSGDFKRGIKPIELTLTRVSLSTFTDSPPVPCGAIREAALWYRRLFPARSVPDRSESPSPTGSDLLR